MDCIMDTEGPVSLYTLDVALFAVPRSVELDWIYSPFGFWSLFLSPTEASGWLSSHLSRHLEQFLRLHLHGWIMFAVGFIMLLPLVLRPAAVLTIVLLFGGRLCAVGTITVASFHICSGVISNVGKDNWWWGCKFNWKDWWDGVPSCGGWIGDKLPSNSCYRFV
ncbi:hypothetical protein K2173_020688 [Erythroxylum novogranatense]|uniref:Uncharacterized protein n=1 Tax=Erythroxylum novogranatense TaxID=1862640 RepID=A0AAV8TPI5_9ROSI|nr:hypothetical protein K2173_020688 [Erythroxylum novogranatense]